MSEQKPFSLEGLLSSIARERAREAHTERSLLSPDSYIIALRTTLARYQPDSSTSLPPSDYRAQDPSSGELTESL